MYVGSVVSVGSSGTSGTVKPTDSDEVFQFKDVNFPSTGLGVDDSCMFDLDCTIAGGTICLASNVQPVEMETTVIKTPQTGDLEIGQTDTVIIKTGGEVLGAINIAGGILKVNGGNVTGDINATQGGLVVVKNDSTVTGNGNFNNSRIKLIGGTLTGHVSLDDSAKGTLKTGGEILGAINIAKGILRVKEGGIVNEINITSAECDALVQPTGEILGAINIAKGSKLKVTN